MITLNGYHHFKASDLLVLETLIWFHDEVVPNSGKEREMRITQALVVCFVLYRDQKFFWRALRSFVIPLIADPDISVEHAVHCTGKRIHDLAKSKAVRQGKIWLAETYEYFSSLEQLNRAFPDSGLAKYCN